MLIRKLTRQLNVLEERARLLKVINDTDNMLKLLRDFGAVLLQVE